MNTVQDLLNKLNELAKTNPEILRMHVLLETDHCCVRWDGSTGVGSDNIFLSAPCMD